MKSEQHEQLAACRATIARLVQQLAREPKRGHDVLKQQAEAAIDRLQAEVVSQVQTAVAKAQAGQALDLSLPHLSPGAAALLAMGREALQTTVARAIGSAPDITPPREREALQTALDEAQREEVQIMRAFEAAGTPVDPRPDADPAFDLAAP